MGVAGGRLRVEPTPTGEDASHGSFVQLTDGTSSIHTHDNHIGTITLYESIGHGEHSGITQERCYGKKTTIGTGAFTLLENQPFIQPSGDIQTYIQSSDAADSSAGTGAQQVTIEYFSYAWGAKKTVIITLNGLNQVTVSVSDMYRIHGMYVNRKGSGSASAGDITLTNQAETELYGQISQYASIMQRAIFYVAEGERVTCTEALFTATTGGGIIGRIFASEEDANGNVVPRARIIFEVADSNIIYGAIISETVENPNNKRLAIGIAVHGNLANQSGSGTLKGFSEAI